MRCSPRARVRCPSCRSWNVRSCLPRDADPAALARFVTIVSQGFAVQAAGGVGCEELKRAVEVAMRAWPTRE